MMCRVLSTVRVSTERSSVQSCRLRLPIRVIAVMAAVALVAAACTDGRDDAALRSAADSESEAAQAEAAGPGSESTPVAAAAERCLDGGESSPHDEALEIGMLANGLTYYLRSNDVPAGHVDLRLVVRAGAMNDPEDASGAAHFVEHMLFNGTEGYPRNELHQALRDIGVEFGPDQNALTDYDSTFYVLSITTSGTERLADKLPVAFQVLSEWASAATITDADVDAERGIVANEFSLRAGSADGHLRSAVENLMFARTRYEGKQVLGSAESIAAMTPRQLRDFYATWYVPSNMAIIAVGDVETQALRDLIENHFAGIPAGLAVPSPLASTSEAPREPQFGHAFHADFGNPLVSVNWTTPTWPRGTSCGERFRLLEQLAFRIVSTRLMLAHEQGLLTQENAPMRLTAVDYAAIPHYSTHVQGADLAGSLRDLWAVVAGPLQHPFTEDELDRAAEPARAELERDAESGRHRHDSDYASEFSTHFVGGADLGTADERLRRGVVVLDAISADELNDFYAWMLSRSTPVVVAAGSPDTDLPTADDLRSAFNAALTTTPIAASSPTAPSTLMESPEPVPFVRSATTSLGSGIELHEWWFDNGAHVVLDPRRVGGGEVFVATESLGGASLLDPEDVPLANFALQAVAASGLGDLNATQVSAAVEESGVWGYPVLDHTTENFIGGAPIEDLETLVALFHLMMTEPRVSDAAAQDARQNARNAAAAAQASALVQTQVAYRTARYGDSAYFDVLPEPAQIDEMTPERLLGLFRQRFVGVDDLTVAITGDVTPDEVATLAQRYIGTLPSRADDKGVDRRPPHPPGVTRVELEADTAAESGVEFIFELNADLSARLVATANVLTAVLNEQLLAGVREAVGQAYEVRASITPLHQPTQTLLAAVVATGPGEALAEIEGRVHSIVEHLATDGPSESDLTQAVAIVANDAHFGGGSFPPLSLLMRRTVEDADLPIPERIETASGEVTAAAVRDLARALFDSGQRIEIARVPAPSG